MHADLGPEIFNRLPVGALKAARNYQGFLRGLGKRLRADQRGYLPARSSSYPCDPASKKARRPSNENPFTHPNPSGPEGCCQSLT